MLSVLPTLAPSGRWSTMKSNFGSLDSRIILFFSFLFSVLFLRILLLIIYKTVNKQKINITKVMSAVHDSKP